MDFLNFTFQSFWVWLGMILLIGTVACWTPIRITKVDKE